MIDVKSVYTAFKPTNIKFTWKEIQKLSKILDGIEKVYEDYTIIIFQYNNDFCALTSYKEDGRFKITLYNSLDNQKLINIVKIIENKTKEIKKENGSEMPEYIGVYSIGQGKHDTTDKEIKQLWMFEPFKNKLIEELIKE